MLNRFIVIANAGYGDCRCRKTYLENGCHHCEFMVTVCSSAQAPDMSLRSPTKAGQTQLLTALLHRIPDPTKTAQGHSEKIPGVMGHWRVAILCSDH